jgi:hypothetical protein
MDILDALEFLDNVNAETVYNIVEERKQLSKQSWSVIKGKSLIAEWNYFTKLRICHNKVIDKFVRICTENYSKLYVNTVLMKHDSIDPCCFMQDFYTGLSPDEIEKWLEDYEDYAVDEKGNWRISDYGLEPIRKYLIDILLTDDYNKKLYLIDCILNVCHQRSDLSAWFVEGGRKTLSVLAQ